jgi:hypothetical protein
MIILEQKVVFIDPSIGRYCNLDWRKASGKRANAHYYPGKPGCSKITEEKNVRSAKFRDFMAILLFQSMDNVM